MTTANEITERTAETEVAELLEYAEPPRWVGTSDETTERFTVTYDNWKLKIRRKGGFSGVIMELDYRTGSGLRRHIQATSRDGVQQWVSRHKDLLPIGYSPYGHSNDDIKRMPEFDTPKSKSLGKFAYGIPQSPNLTDVIHCVVQDTLGYDDARDFEDWAENCGYDPDSRKAYKVWEACAEQARKFRQLLKPGDMERLEEALQDY